MVISRTLSYKNWYLHVTLVFKQFAFSSPSLFSLLVRLWICSQNCASLMLLESLCVPGTRRPWKISWLNRQIGQKRPMTLKLLGKPDNIVGWLILPIFCIFFFDILRLLCLCFFLSCLCYYMYSSYSSSTLVRCIWLLVITTKLLA